MNTLISLTMTEERICSTVHLNSIITISSATSSLTPERSDMEGLSMLVHWRWRGRILADFQAVYTEGRGGWMPWRNRRWRRCECLWWKRTEKKQSNFNNLRLTAFVYLFTVVYCAPVPHRDTAHLTQDENCMYREKSDSRGWKISYVCTYYWMHSTVQSYVCTYY